jgi:hypothetical protein
MVIGPRGTVCDESCTYKHVYGMAKFTQPTLTKQLSRGSLRLLEPFWQKNSPMLKLVKEEP